MPSTEFLLYLVIVIFIVYIIINYYKDTSVSEPEIQYKYIPVYNDNKSTQRTEQNQYQDSGIGYPAGGIAPPFAPGPVPGPVPGPMAGPGPIDPLRKFDYDAIEDDFTPPFRRSYYDDNNYRLAPGLYPAYTRGPPGRFRKVGTLIAQTFTPSGGSAGAVTPNDKFKFMILMGRQKYSNRDYEYFVTSPDSDQRLKFYIDTNGREISNGDTVTVTELSGYSFTFNEDPDLSPKYDPYVI
jgi:hypothetical protein